MCEAHLARIVKVDLKSELFTYAIDERALKHAKMMDGTGPSTVARLAADTSRVKSRLEKV